MLKILVGAMWLLVVVSQAEAAPVRCSYGYQDSSCVHPISHAPIPQPQCPTSAGWTTTAGAVWQGAQWSSPQCSYQAQPTCPAGDTTVSSATWTGSSWTNPVCAPPPPDPQVTPVQEEQACQTALGISGATLGAGNEMFVYIGTSPDTGGSTVAVSYPYSIAARTGVFLNGNWTDTYGPYLYAADTNGYGDVSFAGSFPMATDLWQWHMDNGQVNGYACWIASGTTNVVETATGYKGFGGA